LTISPIRDRNGRVIGSSKIARDVSIERRREEQLAHFSQHDQLTGLPNRQLLHDRLEMMLAQAERNSHQCAVMVLDLDNFKEINDHHGHHIGDELLVETANRLKSSLRNVDTVSRVGGDEFIILVSELHRRQDALLVAEKLRDSFKRPFPLSNDIVVNINVSIGICMNTPGSVEGNLLLRMADTAMYHAKAIEGSQIEFYSEEIARHEFRRREIVVALQEALQAEEFNLEYHPIVNIQTGGILGFEALIRLQNRRVGMVFPNEFIPIAEETGLIRLIGNWVIRKACQAIGDLNRELGSAFFISVNLSPKQFQDETLLSVVETALKDNYLGRGQLEVEITESALMRDSPKILGFLHALRALGVLIEIDDFGTGFSNISYLWHFPVDRLKLDRSIVNSLSSHPGSSVVAKAIIALAHQLNITVIAEGIETLEQAEILKGAQCDLAQGFYFGRPAPFELYKTLLSGR
jgi:diguanylate cyclase (GGDEF)-like protein